MAWRRPAQVLDRFLMLIKIDKI